jgi:hypothetical protein
MVFRIVSSCFSGMSRKREASGVVPNGNPGASAAATEAQRSRNCPSAPIVRTRAGSPDG